MADTEPYQGVRHIKGIIRLSAKHTFKHVIVTFINCNIILNIHEGRIFK